MPATTEQPAQRIFEALDATEAPAGFRAEILGDEGITMSPTPSGLHQHNIWELDGQLRAHLPRRTRTEGHLEIRMYHLARSVIPDLFVAPIDVLATAEHQISPDEVLLVSEVVSPSSQEIDRVRKLAIYSAAQIPLYLLVDPLRGSVTLYSTPVSGEYTVSTKVGFGKPLFLPAPFTVDLDTGRFRAH